MHAREMDKELQADTDSNLDKNNYTRGPVVYWKLAAIIGNIDT
jgi:hypothetical protein